MSGFIVSNSFGTYHSKRAETVKPQSFAVETQGFGLSQIASGDTLKQIWSSPTKSAQVFKNNTVVCKGNSGNNCSYYPGSSSSATQALRNYSEISDMKISLYDDNGKSADGNRLNGAARVAPAAGTKQTWDILVVNCASMFNHMKSGGGTKIRDKYPWGNVNQLDFGDAGDAVGTAGRNTSWDTGSNRAVTVTLNGDKGDYIEIDTDGGAMTGKNFSCQVDGVYYGTGKQPDNYCPNSLRIDLYWRGAAELPKEGCMDGEADNICSDCNKEKNSLCTYTTSGISTFTVSPTSIKEGESVTINWNLSNANFSEVQVLMNGTNIMPSNLKTSKSQSFSYTPTSIGTKSFRLKVKWDKNQGGDKQSGIKRVSVVAQPSYVECTDPNRAKDSNGECADCNSGYHIGADGLCTQCQDPNRDMDSDGQCTDCMTGYALGDDGLCQKAGCTDPDDYNYDPDAVIADDSLCEGTTDDDDDDDDDPIFVPEEIDCEVSDWSEWSEWSDPDTQTGTRTRTRTVVTPASGGGADCPSLEETETAVIDSTTGEITITTQGGDTTPVEKETKSPLPIILAGVVGLGLLAVAMRR